MTTFTYTPDFPATETTTLRLRTSNYGSYEERLAYGLFTIIDTWSISFGSRNSTDHANILSFLEAAGGTTPFTWTTPFGDTAQFLCADWQSTLDSCNLSTVSASFVLANTSAGPNITTPSAPTGAFTYIPDFGASQQYDTKAKQIELGDGYKQAVTFGLYPQQIEWPLTFANRTNTERDAIRTYLRGARGQTAFTWTTPYGTTAKFVCAEWRTAYASYNNNTINATFRRVFES
jgi:phage-related protein